MFANCGQLWGTVEHQTVPKWTSARDFYYPIRNTSAASGISRGNAASGDYWHGGGQPQRDG